MRIERSRCRMIQVYRRNYANLVTELIFQFFSNCLVFNCSRLIHINRTAVCLMSCRNRCCCRSRVRTEGCGVKCRRRTCYREAHHRKLFVSGKDIGRRILFHRSKIICRRLNLRIAHTVSDKQEYVFRSCRCRFFCKYRKRRRCCTKCHRCCQKSCCCFCHFIFNTHNSLLSYGMPSAAIAAVLILFSFVLVLVFWFCI